MVRLSRRKFLCSSPSLAAAATIPGRNPSPSPDERPRIKRYKPFGKTGWKVGDISAGSGQRDPGMFEHLFRCGINLVDTAYQYPGHEETLGKILPKWRDKVFIVGKWDPPLVTPKVSKATLLEALDVSLKRLNTKFIDCFMIHSIGHPRYGGMDRIQNPAIYEAWDEAKKMGKIKFTGASSHGVRMLEEIGWGLDNDRFDVILIGANFLTHGVEPLLKRARAKGVATMAMKTMTIYKSDLNIHELQGEDTNARQAVIKWILASDLFDTMIISMRNFEQVKEYLAVSGTSTLTAQDRSYLKTLAGVIGPQYCRPGCDGCYGSCPHDVPIWDILRYRMYFEHYGDQKFAMERYQLVPAANRATACESCDGPCERSCRYNVNVRERLIEANRMLTMV
jgi:predicted aldo/keto reductase-like oxidoreductase